MPATSTADVIIEVFKILSALVSPLLVLLVSKKLNEVKIAVDGKMDKILEVTGALRTEEGRRAGIAEAKAEIITNKEIARQDKKDIIADSKETGGETVLENLTVKAKVPGEIETPKINDKDETKNSSI